MAKADKTKEKTKTNIKVVDKKGKAKQPPKDTPVAAAPETSNEKKVEKLSPTKERKALKLPFRQRITLSSLLLWTVLSAIVFSAGVSGFHALRVLYQNKLTDTWAILFLELEREGNWLVQKLEKFSTARIENGVPASPAGQNKNNPDAVFEISDNGSMELITGTLPKKAKLIDFALRSTDFKTKWTILQYAGVEYLGLVSRGGKIAPLIDEDLSDNLHLVLWRIDIQSWFAHAGNEERNDIVYVVSKEGRVIYTNDREITPRNYVQRPLVQKFVSNPLRQGQLEFDDDSGEPYYGFFMEVPNTNLLIFVETSKAAALHSVKEVAVGFGFVLLTILCLVGILLQFPLTTFVVAPLRELVRVANEIGDGNFKVKPSREGLGELSVLSKSFSDMAQNLFTRDEKIQHLLVEQQEKIRLADELAVAQNIQNNFLSSEPLPEDSGLEVAAHYTPAAECAGDWYSYYHDEGTGQSTFAIADVSGHGVGSAMFTAIIAATFEECKLWAMANRCAFPMEEFALRLNRVIMKLGHGKMHATLLVACAQKGVNEVQILNAGHPFPVMVFPSEFDKRSEPVGGRSDLVGVSLDFNPSVENVPFPTQSSLLMFTDGLIEGSPDHRLYTERKLNKACQISQKQSVSVLIKQVFEDWQAHLGGQQPLDDVCLLAVKAA